MDATDKPAPPNHRAALLSAALAVVVLRHLLPFGPLLLYPFTLLATWVHEMGHGLTALLCGGQFQDLTIYGDASGLAHTAVLPGWRAAATAAGGLLAPPLWGALLLWLGRRHSRLVLSLLLAEMIASLALWIQAPLGWATVGGLAAVLALIAIYGSAGLRIFTTQFLGILLALDTVSRMGYLFVRSALVGGTQRTSDIAGIADVLGGPYWLWGVLISAVSLLLLLLGLRAAWRVRR